MLAGLDALFPCATAGRPTALTEPAATPGAAAELTGLQGATLRAYYCGGLRRSLLG